MAKGFKTGGRQIGSSNKITSDLREKISKVIGLELEGLEGVLNSLTTKERLDVLVKLIPYVITKATFDNDDSPTTIVVNFEETRTYSNE
jgi:hypothetical protein